MDTVGSIIWYLAKLGLLTVALILLGAVTFWVYAERKGVVFQMRCWSEEKKHLLTVTYFYLVSSYLLTVLSATYVFSSPLMLEIMTFYPKQVVFITLVIMTILTALLEYIPYSEKDCTFKTICWILHSIMMGPSFAYFGYFICVESTLKASLAVSVATLVSLTAPLDLYIDIKPQVELLYSAVTVSSFLCFLFNPPVNAISLILLAFNLCGGMLLYFAVFITNTQYMLNNLSQSCYDPVYTAAVMYLSTLNLMLRVAMFHVVELTDITEKDDSPCASNTRTVPSFS